MGLVDITGSFDVQNCVAVVYRMPGRTQLTPLCLKLLCLKLRAAFLYVLLYLGTSAILVRVTSRPENHRVRTNHSSNVSFAFRPASTPSTG